jgi:hypothetical protein
MPAEFVVVVPTGTQMGAVEKARLKENWVNINGSEDQFYRYKCPQLVCTVPNAHASKMVKTSICNIEDVANSLQRPPSCAPPNPSLLLLPCPTPAPLPSLPPRTPAAPAAPLPAACLHRLIFSLAACV